MDEGAKLKLCSKLAFYSNLSVPKFCMHINRHLAERWLLLKTNFGPTMNIGLMFVKTSINGHVHSIYVMD